jgi:hypothetical protein
MAALCRICHEEEGVLRRPCRCRGSVAAVHEECLKAWIRGGEARDHCELCGVGYLFQHDRPLEYVSRAVWLCESVWGNIGTHIVFRYMLLTVLHLNEGVLDALYHLGFLLYMGAFVSKTVLSPIRLYIWHGITHIERIGFALLYGFLWIGAAIYEIRFCMIGLQTFLPLFPYFHMKTLKEMNASRQWQLLDWREE